MVMKVISALHTSTSGMTWSLKLMSGFLVTRITRSTRSFPAADSYRTLEAIRASALVSRRISPSRFESPRGVARATSTSGRSRNNECQTKSSLSTTSKISRIPAQADRSCYGSAIPYADNCLLGRCVHLVRVRRRNHLWPQRSRPLRAACGRAHSADRADLRIAKIWKVLGGVHEQRQLPAGDVQARLGEEKFKGAYCRC